MGSTTTPWTIGCGRPPHAHELSADVTMSFAKALHNPRLGEALIQHLISPWGAVMMADLWKIPRVSAGEAIVAAGCEPGFIDTYEMAVFPEGKHFPPSAAKGETGGMDDASLKGCGGYRPKKFSSNQDNDQKTVTDILGGAAATQRLQFSDPVRKMLVEMLSKAKPDYSGAMHLVFKWWCVSFLKPYLDQVTKVKVSWLLHGMNNLVSAEEWQSRLIVAFSNKRQGRFQGSLQFNPMDLSHDGLQKLLACELPSQVSAYTSQNNSYS